MRHYGNIQTKFWTHHDITRLSDQAKLLGSYLLTSPHTTMLGCFRLPIGYIAEDLRWDIETSKKALQDLIEIDFLIYDETNQWVMIHNFLKYHPIENPNQGLSIVKLFDEIPNHSTFTSNLITKLLQQTKHLDEGFCNRLQTLLKPFLNQEQYQEQKQEQKDMSGTPDVDSLNILSFEKSNQQSVLKSQALEILNFLNEKTGRAYRPADSNLKLIMARLKTGATVMDCR